MAEKKIAPNQDSEKQRRKAKLFQRCRLWSVLYLLVFPTVFSLLVFSYYPKIDVVIMSFYRWQPPSVQEFIGLENFKNAFADPIFWKSFRLVGILLVCNLFKLWPGILAAIALHRLLNDRLRYFFQVMFVVPMVIPAMVWLLIWKSFYDPTFGLLNGILNKTGLMGVLNFLDTFMPALANHLQPFFNHFIDPAFGNVGGLIAMGAFMAVLGGRRPQGPLNWSEIGILLAGAVWIPLARYSGLSTGFTGGVIAGIISIGWMVVAARSLGKVWVLWALFFMGGNLLFLYEPWRLPVLFLVCAWMARWLQAHYDPIRKSTVNSWICTGLFGAGFVLILLGKMWIATTGEFTMGTPAWLGSSSLVIPSIVFWGFPWVGTVGVLIYLSGLQNISQDVYEAAELDGVGAIGKILYIELPLIMTQVRINLIFMTISTLTMYELFLILLGPDGGPGNKGMVPGLYMFSSAFSEGQFGFACALGMVLFVVIMILTIIYQRYVKVDK